MCLAMLGVSRERSQNARATSDLAFTLRIQLGNAKPQAASSKLDKLQASS